jgi:cell wall-associated NlpC family hydrolase
MIAAAALFSGACATSGAVPRPFPGAISATGAGSASNAPAPTTPNAPDAPNAPIAPNAPDLLSPRFDGRAIAQFALGFRGVPYRLGGADPGGFDCSGLVQYVFAQYGVTVPRVVEQQYEVGDTIRPSDIKPGDLIFFNTKRRGDGASHVGIAIGQDSFVHAPNSSGVVRIETLGSAYWGSRYLGARRVTPSSLTATR